MKRLSVVVGVPAAKNAMREGGVNNATLAAAHEFGATIQHPGGTSHGYRTEKDAITGKHRFLKAGTGYMVSGKTGPHTINIPERSFLRSTLTENADAAATMLAQGMRAVLVNGEETQRPFEAVGLTLSDLVKQKINAGIAPPLAESTRRQRRKKAGYLSKKQKAARQSRGLTPLIDTGELIQSITYEVRDD